MRTLRTRIVLLVGTLVLLTVALRQGWLALPLDLVTMITSPVIQSVTQGGTRVVGVVRSFIAVGGLTERVRFLEEAAARLTAENARLHSVQRENEELRAALDLRPRTAGERVIAEVVGPATDGASTAVRINRGTANGVQPGAPVVAAGSVVVGRVSRALPHSAIVELITGGRFRLTARDVSTNAEGIVRGLRGLDVVIEGVPRTDQLRAGDRLVTTGIDGVFPPHLFIGTVRDVRTPEFAIFQEASVEPPVDIRRLRIVAVLTRDQ